MEVFNVKKGLVKVDRPWLMHGSSVGGSSLFDPS